MEKIGDRIKMLRKQRNISQAVLAKLANVSQPVIAELEAGRQETSKRLPLIARALGVSLSELDPSFDRQTEEIMVSYVHVRGNVQAGIWTEFDEVPADTTELVPIVPGKYANLEQTAFLVRGASMNKARLFDGDYVICVPYFMARQGITDADIAVVERRRGATVERTVKQISIDRGSCMLWPRSDDPRFQSPIPCHGPEADGTEIEITQLVIGVYTPVRY